VVGCALDGLGVSVAATDELAVLHDEQGDRRTQHPLGFGASLAFAVGVAALGERRDWLPCTGWRLGPRAPLCGRAAAAEVELAMTRRFRRLRVWCASALVCACQRERIPRRSARASTRGGSSQGRVRRGHAGTVTRIARAQGISLTQARDRAVSDALFATAARAKLEGTSVVPVAERGALARALLEGLKADAISRGPAATPRSPSSPHVAGRSWIAQKASAPRTLSRGRRPRLGRPRRVRSPNAFETPCAASPIQKPSCAPPRLSPTTAYRCA